MNKKTKALTTEQYQEIIMTMKNGAWGIRPNERIATALVIEANLGLRISDVLRLRLIDIVRDGNRYRLDIIEQKTKKKRMFTVPMVIYQYLEHQVSNLVDHSYIPSTFKVLIPLYIVSIVLIYIYYCNYIY